MLQLKKNNRNWYIKIGVSVIFLFSLAASFWYLSKDRYASNYLFEAVFSPIRHAVHSIHDSWETSKIWLHRKENILGERQHLLDEIEILHTQLQLLNLKNKAMSEAQYLLKNKVLGIDEVIAAPIIKRNVFGKKNELVIKLGRKNGIEEGDLVFNRQNIVGIVQHVFNNTSVVSTLFDHKHFISVFSKNTGSIFTFLGTGKGLKPFDDEKHDLQIGDKLLTSGLGGRYPYGLVLGHVVMNRETKLPQIHWDVNMNHGIVTVGVFNAKHQYFMSEVDCYQDYLKNEISMQSVADSAFEKDPYCDQ